MASSIPEITLPSGHFMPLLGLGSWDLRGEDGIRAFKAALDMGYTHFDTADLYENQPELGEAVKGWDRESLFITSKVQREHLHYDDAIAICEKALRELKTDYLDLYLIHWPNPDIPMEETFDALHSLVQQGKTRSIGVSNFTPQRLEEAIAVSPSPIVNNQVEFHPLLYNQELLAFCNMQKVSVTAYSPLARGKVHSQPVIMEIAAKYERTTGDVTLRWLVQKGLVIIPKAASEKHMRANMQVFDWELAPEDEARIDAIEEHVRLVAPEHIEFN